MVEEQWCDITDGRTDGRTNGRGYNNIPAFSSTSAGITMAANLPSLLILIATVLMSTPKYPDTVGIVGGNT